MRSLVQIQVGPRDRLCTSAIKALFPTGSELADSFPVAELDATKEALEAAIEDPALTGLCWEYMRGDVGQPVEAVAANEFISGLLSTRSSPSSESARCASRGGCPGWCPWVWPIRVIRGIGGDCRSG